MKTIRDMDYAILIITENYLKSFNCMYEVMELMKEKDYHNKIFPVLYATDIYKPANKQNAIEWGINIYKINDPILFNESERFAPLIYNNMKGKIIDIEKQDYKIRFDIELDIAINELDAEYYEFDLVGNSENGNSIISFWVNKYKSTDEDDDSLDTIVPFQIAYAISIHKAQGLEYNSVKIVITNEVEERITHNIFYTAITRAKEELKIYWTPETENKILNSFELKNSTKDVALLKSMYSI